MGLHEFYLCALMQGPALRTSSDPTRFVLVHASHAGNVGATARAMRVMGFHDLVLVAPRHADVLQQPQARAMASGAHDVLASARIVPTLADALSGVQVACATAMTPRDFGPPVFAPRARLSALAQEGASVAFVFGGERWGLSNDDVYRCHLCLSVPTAEGFGSLNLAQAVILCAYEWSKHASATNDLVQPTVEDILPPAPQDEFEGMFGQICGMLEPRGYFEPAPRAEATRRTLRTVLTKPAWNHLELRTFRGVLSALARTPGVRTPRGKN